MLSCKNVVSRIFARVNEFQIDKTTGHAEYPRSDIAQQCYFNMFATRAVIQSYNCNSHNEVHFLYRALLRARTVH